MLLTSESNNHHTFASFVLAAIAAVSKWIEVWKKDGMRMIINLIVRII